MSAGTLTLTNNSAAVTGAGTTFTTDLAAGDFIVVAVGGVPYTLPIKAVNSNTSMTLVSNYTGPTQSGASFSAVPRLALMQTTAALVAQSAEALRGLNYDKQNWQKLFSGTGTITVKLPDGSTYSGPAWNSITTALGEKAAKGENSDITKLSGLTTALSIEQGGTGAKNASDARAKLELGNSATLDAGELDNNVMKVGAGGLLSRTPPLIESKWNMYSSGFRRSSGGSDNGLAYGAGIYCSYDSTICFNLHIEGGGVMRYRYLNGSAVRYDYVIYSTGNTTKASDGTLKAASPVARIIADPAKCERGDIIDDGFTWCGCGTANAEAEGITISRLDVGVYVLMGSAGLASEGWQLLPPMDPGGMGELGVVEAEETESGGITIRLYERKYKLGDDGDIVKTKGNLIDVPASSWIDVRLDMPESSIWNQRQKETINSILQEPAS